MSRSLENLEQFAIDVILERRGGVRAALLRSFLYLLSLIYERLVQFRLSWGGAFSLQQYNGQPRQTRRSERNGSRCRKKVFRSHTMHGL